MKKAILTFFLVLFFTSVALSAASYMDNPYQKLAREYSEKSQQSFDEGNYDAAVEYSRLAEENAALSEGYTDLMLAKFAANTRLSFAKNRFDWATGIRAAVFYPMAYTAAKRALSNGDASFETEEYALAEDFANKAIEALADVKEVIPLPSYYVVKPWESEKDCYWNISGRPFVYNNPLLWENLYEANKDEMVDPSNPDLIYPGMKMHIPSISGELREGIYSSENEYETYTQSR